MASFRHLVILLRHAGSSPLHANNVSHSLNLLPKALSKKCHRLQRASQFPERSPVKSALHYILPLPHDSLSLLSCHGLIFFLLTFQERTCQRSLHSIRLPSTSQKHSSNPRPLKCVRLTKSGPRCNWPSASLGREAENATTGRHSCWELNQYNTWESESS